MSPRPGPAGGRGRPAKRAAPGGWGRAAPAPRSGGAGRGSAGGRDAGRGSGAGGRAATPGRGTGAGGRAAPGRGTGAGGGRAAGRTTGGRAAPPGAAGRPPRSGGRAGAAAVAPRRPSAPRALGGEQVEGRQAVRELLLAGRRRAEEIWLADDVDAAPILDDILELADDAKVPVRRVSRRRLEGEARTDAPQGVLARAAPLPEADLDDLAARPKGATPPFLLAVDGVTDPGNLGALLRSADGAGVTGVVLPRHRAVHVTPSVTKAAAGAVEHLPMAVVGGLPAALARLRERGVWVVGLDAAGDRTLWDLDLGDEPVCVVLGAEGRGLARLTRARCDEVVAIPLRGALASLNVAAAGALACFEVARRRRR